VAGISVVGIEIQAGGNPFGGMFFGLDEKLTRRGNLK
jgi:hypothetical protein